MNPSEHLPGWLKVERHSEDNFQRIKSLLSQRQLHTVCQGAKCPNIWECWNCGTATFMILGEVCTRGCTFCGVGGAESGQPVDEEEPRKLAEVIQALALAWVVITSVTRDDLADGGAGHFAECVSRIRALCPETGLELLIPDFQGNRSSMQTVIDSEPQVIAHNVETVPRLYPAVRPQASYRRSLEVLSFLAEKAGPEVTVKSSLILGLGETVEEVEEVVRDLFLSGCRAVTLGQYLRPSKNHYPVMRYYTPLEFEKLAGMVSRAGIPNVSSGPLVRSSYEAHKLAGRALFNV